MLNDKSLDILEKHLKDINDVNTELVSKKKGVQYPFVYLDNITQVEIDIYKQYIKENPGEVPLMIKLEKGFANLGSTNLDLKLLLTLSKFSERDIHIKLNKDKVIPIEDIIPNMLLNRKD
jgi:hypothetical protein